MAAIGCSRMGTRPNFCSHSRLGRVWVPDFRVPIRRERASDDEAIARIVEREAETAKEERRERHGQWFW